MQAMISSSGNILHSGILEWHVQEGLLDVVLQMLPVV